MIRGAASRRRWQAQTASAAAVAAALVGLGAGIIAVAAVPEAARGVADRPTPSAPARPGSVEGLWQAARQAVPGDTAMARYGTVVRRYPRHALAQAALMELADYQYAVGECQAARQYYHRVRGPLAARARLGEALCVYALGDPAQARRLAQPLVRAKDAPLTWLAALLVAQSWEAEGRIAETLGAYRRLLELPAGPAQPAALLGAARAAERVGQGDASAQYLAELLRRYPGSPEAAEARSLARRTPLVGPAAVGAAEPAPQGKP
jgi:TolA-binding protein